MTTIDQVVERLNLRLAADSAARLGVDIDLEADVPCVRKHCDSPATVLVRTRCCRATNTFCGEHLLDIAASIERANQNPEIGWFQCFCGFVRLSPSSFEEQFTTESIR